MRRLIEYNLPNGAYTVDYDEDRNVLVHTLSTPGGWVREDAGNRGDVVKFDATTVDAYIVQAVGRSIPVHVKEAGTTAELNVLVWSKKDLDRVRMALRSGRYEEILKENPSLQRVYKSGIPDRTQPHMQVVQLGGHYVAGPSGIVDTVVVDAGDTTFMTADGQALTDIRSVLGDAAELHIRSMLDGQSNNG